MLDTVFPRIPGDVGNALTWPFPVRYKIVTGAVSSRVMADRPDAALLESFIEAARELEADGVSAITTSCGFLAIFQRELAAAVSVPVLTSSLLQVPMAAQLIGASKRVGILTERPTLTPQHFQGAGWSSNDISIQVGTLAPDAVFPTVFIDGGTQVDTDILEAEMVDAAMRLTRDHSDVAALVLECTNFVPFSQAIRRATRLPTYDLYTLVIHTYEATIGRKFSEPE